jgi:hypothetical protein
METHFSLKNNSIQDLVVNEENGYPVPDLNKTMTNVTKEHSVAHEKPSKKKYQKKTLRNSGRKYETWSTRIYKMYSRYFKTPKISIMR